MATKSQREQLEYDPLSGINVDFSTLLKRFVDSGSVRYEQFAEIWRDMEMMTIFCGRQMDKEVREMTEKCFHLAKCYMLPPNEFQVQTGGLYLLYALYFKQLFKPKSKVRVTLDEWVHMQGFMEEVRTQKHYDIEYIFSCLRHDNAFHFTASPNVMTGFTFTTVNERSVGDGGQSTVPDLDVLQPDHSSVAELMDGDNVDQLSAIHDQYHRVKCAMAGPTAKEPQVSLSMIDNTLVQYLTKKITNFEFWKKNRASRRPGRKRQDSGPTTSDSDMDSESEKIAMSPKRRGGSMGRRRAEIKARAMSDTTEVLRSRRYKRIQSMAEVMVSPGTSSPGRGTTSSTQEEDSSNNKSGSLDISMNSIPGSSLPGFSMPDDRLSMPTFSDLVTPKEPVRRARGRPKKIKSQGRGRPRNSRNISKDKAKSPKIIVVQPEVDPDDTMEVDPDDTMEVDPDEQSELVEGEVQEEGKTSKKNRNSDAEPLRKKVKLEQNEKETETGIHNEEESLNESSQFGEFEGTPRELEDSPVKSPVKKTPVKLRVALKPKEPGKKRGRGRPPKAQGRGRPKKIKVEPEEDELVVLE